VLENYLDLMRNKIERNAKQRREKLANLNDERLRTLQAIEDDKVERRERERMRERHPSRTELTSEAPSDLAQPPPPSALGGPDANEQAP